jgi:hypothetical protein
MSVLLLASSGNNRGDSTGTLLLANSAGVQQRLASLVQQVAGLQQEAAHQQQHRLFGYGSMSAAHPTGRMQDSLDPVGPLSRPAASVGAVLRSLSTRNPRVLALAAAAAKAPAGTPQHAAVLSALKDEIMQAVQPAAETATQDAGTADNGPACEDSTGTGHVGLDPHGLPLSQQQPLTQDALWAALMAKAAERAGGNACANHQGSRSTQQQQQAASPKALPDHGSIDSGKETDGTSCSLPWALLQAAQQAQQEEDEKEAAAAAAAQAASDAAAAAAAAQAAPDAAAAAAQPTAMAVDMPEGGPPGSPHRSSSSLPRVGSQVVFKRHSTLNSNALQKHFSSKQPQQRKAPRPPARTQSDAAGVPRPMYTFKKQARKQPLLLHGNSSGNLTTLQQASRHEGATNSPSMQAAGEQPECSAESGGAAAAASFMSADHHSGSLSGGSMRAPAITAPAALGNSSVTYVLSFLASRERQLHALQNLLQLYRPKMQAAAGAPKPGSCSTLAGYLGARGPFQSTPPAAASFGLPTDSSNTAAAISELQRLLNSRVTGVTPNSPPAAAAAGACSSLPEQMETDTMSCGTRPGDDASGGAPSAMLTQAEHMAHQLQQQHQQLLQQQQQQHSYEAVTAPAGSVHNLATLRALASALAERQQPQQQQQQQQAPAAAAGLSGSGLAGALSGANADLLRKLAAALQPMV